MSIYITIHFDPGSGITFSLGASRVYFPPGRSGGDRPVTDEQVFIVDRVDNLNPATERARLIEFVGLVSGWLQEAHAENERIRDERRQRSERDSDYGKVRTHIFFWDMLEVRQLRRMFERHMEHPDVVGLIELLVRLFPPESVLPDPEAFRSQPGTVVKEVLRALVGLPLAHDYTLLEAANVFYPRVLDNGETYQHRLPFGFVTPMSDQIPFERAYELWEDRVFLRHPEDNKPPEQWRRYYRHEIVSGIERATTTRLRALEHVVRRLREHHRDRLTLRKSAFTAAPPPQARIPEQARGLLAFKRLNATCDELQNRQDRALPVEEQLALLIVQ
jgi:hypothetical protein